MTIAHALPAVLWLAVAVVFNGVCHVAAAMIRATTAREVIRP